MPYKLNLSCGSRGLVEDNFEVEFQLNNLVLGFIGQFFGIPINLLVFMSICYCIHVVGTPNSGSDSTVH